MTARLATSWHTMNKLEVETKTGRNREKRKQSCVGVDAMERKKRCVKKRHFVYIMASTKNGFNGVHCAGGRQCEAHSSFVRRKKGDSLSDIVK